MRPRFFVLCALVLALFGFLVAPTIYAVSTLGQHSSATQLVTPPQDADKPYVTLFGDTSKSDFAELVAACRQDKELCDTCRVQVVDTRSARYAELFKRNTSAPMVRAQAPNGTTLFELTDRGLLRTPARTVGVLKDKLGCKRRHQPQPVVNPVDEPRHTPVVDEPVYRRHIPWVAAFIATLVGFGLALARYVNRGRK